MASTARRRAKQSAARDGSAGDLRGPQMEVAEAVCSVLDSIGAAYALIGGRAVGIRGYPRMTLDYDFLTTDDRVLQAAIWKPLIDAGAAVDTRKGDYDDPLAGVTHIAFADSSEADIVLAKWKWEAGVIARAEPMTLGSLHVPVPRVSDLILLKLSAGGMLDLQDVAVLLDVNDRSTVTREVEEHIASLDARAAEEWRKIIGARQR
jgi:hypothetical protein